MRKMWCEKICSMHKNPINCLLHLIAGIILIYALWMHSIKLILVGILIAVIGHIIQASTNKKTKTSTNKAKKKTKK